MKCPMPTTAPDPTASVPAVPMSDAQVSETERLFNDAVAEYGVPVRARAAFRRLIASHRALSARLSARTAGEVAKRLREMRSLLDAAPVRYASTAADACDRAADALDALTAEMDKLRGINALAVQECGKATARARAMEAQVERLTEALRTIADHDAWDLHRPATSEDGIHYYGVITAIMEHAARFLSHPERPLSDLRMRPMGQVDDADLAWARTATGGRTADQMVAEIQAEQPLTDSEIEHLLGDCGRPDCAVCSGERAGAAGLIGDASANTIPAPSERECRTCLWSGNEMYEEPCRTCKKLEGWPHWQAAYDTFYAPTGTTEAAEYVAPNDPTPLELAIAEKKLADEASKGGQQ